MAEVLVQMTDLLKGTDGKYYVPRVCGREREDGRWEGWIEFVQQGEGAVLRSRRETTQPNRQDLMYWATGLNIAFLEGSLERTLEPIQPVRRVVDVEPAYDRPAPDPHVVTERVPPPPHPLLDPFKVYGQGEDILRKELMALDAPRLVDIVIAYDLHEGEPANLYRAALAELILAGVRRRVGSV